MEGEYPQHDEYTAHTQKRKHTKSSIITLCLDVMQRSMWKINMMILLNSGCGCTSQIMMVECFVLSVSLHCHDWQAPTCIASNTVRHVSLSGPFRLPGRLLLSYCCLLGRFNMSLCYRCHWLYVWLPVVTTTLYLLPERESWEMHSSWPMYG